MGTVEDSFDLWLMGRVGREHVQFVMIFDRSFVVEAGY